MSEYEKSEMEPDNAGKKNELALICYSQQSGFLRNIIKGSIHALTIILCCLRSQNIASLLSMGSLRGDCFSIE